MKQVLVIRKDLNMRKGKMISQAAHVSVFVAILFCWHPFFWIWLCKDSTKIAVSVDSEEELLEIYKKASKALIPTAMVQDLGKTEFAGRKTYTAVAVGPAPNDWVDKITGHLRLL